MVEKTNGTNIGEKEEPKEETNREENKKKNEEEKEKTKKEESESIILKEEKGKKIENKKIIKSIKSEENEIGIHLIDASDNTLTNNTANSNFDTGICLSSSSYNTLTNNTANSNSENGIILDYSPNNTLTNNTANLNDVDGIKIWLSSNNFLTNNTANLNSWEGIHLYSSPNNTLTNNTANSNSYGGIILQHNSNNNTLTNNIANSNKEYGIFLYSSSNNILINNISCFNEKAGLSICGGNNNYLINPISIGNGESDIKTHTSLNTTHASSINTTIIDPIIGSWNLDLELQENTKIIITPDYYNNFENASNRITKSYNKTQEYISSEIARREEEIANLNSKGIKSTKKQKEYFEILKRPIETQKKQIEAQRKYAETQYNTIKGKINIDNLNYTQILPNKEKIKYSIYNDEEGIGESLITYINTIRDDTTKVDVKEKNNIGNDTTNVDNRGIFEKVDELTKELYKLYPDPESSTQEELTIYIPKSFEGRHITLVENARSM